MSIEIRKNIRDILPKRAKEAFQKLHTLTNLLYNTNLRSTMFDQTIQHLTTEFLLCRVNK